MEEKSPRQDIINILEEVMSIINNPEADVSWSGYNTVEEALLDLADHIARLTQRDLSRRNELTLLFFPTGPLQEISLSSGWGERFLNLAARFDAANRQL